MANIITQKTDVLEQWRLNFNQLSQQVGDPTTIYTTDGTDTFTHTTNLLADAINDLNTRKVKRSGDTIASLSVTGTLAVGGACTVQTAVAATNPLQLQQLSNNTLGLSVTTITASGNVQFNGAGNSLNVAGTTYSTTLIVGDTAAPTQGYAYFGKNGVHWFGFNGTTFDMNGALNCQGNFSSTGSLTGTQLAVGSWGITPSGSTIIFSFSGTNVAKIDSSGNLTVKASITAFGVV